MKEPRDPQMIAEDLARAEQYAQPGTVEFYLLRKGFLPANQADAEAMLDRIIAEWEEANPDAALNRDDPPPIVPTRTVSP